MGYRVAVVGGTGNVGREMLATLAEHEFPADEVVPLASDRSAGAEVSYGEDETLKVRKLDGFDFKGFDLALFSPGAKVSAVHAPGAGKEAMDELFNQTRAVFVNDAIEKEHFTKQIAFNVIPHIDVFMQDGATKEEWKMVVETRKILDPGIAVSATCVRVPVFIGHGEAVNAEFESPITVEQARAALKQAPGITVVDHRVDEGYVTPVECTGEDAVFVSRIRRDTTVEHGLSLWVVSDNLRKGAALNAVQIAERLVESYL